MSRVDTLIEDLSNEYISKFPREVAQYCEDIAPEVAAKVVARIPDKNLSSIWFYIRMSLKEKIFGLLPMQDATRLLNIIDVAPSAAILINMDAAQRKRYLFTLEPVYANYIQDFISYPEDSAARMMDGVSHVYNDNLTVNELLVQLKNVKSVPSTYIYLTDEDHVLGGAISIHQLLIADDKQTLGSLTKANTVSISAFARRHEVLETFEQEKADCLPVVDGLGHVIGMIYSSKIFEELKDDVITDIQTMVGVNRNETALSPSLYAVRLRLPWLFINLVTAFMAAAVVGLFEGTIEQVTVLAVLLPVVAGQSGNAGAQALAVSMRGLAIREFAVTQYLSVVRKEAFVGLATGALVASVCGFGVYMWTDNYILGMVLSASMVISICIACISGVLVPIILKRLRQDPAQSSSIILTTITDIVGFFSFLGIATLVIKLILNP